MAKKTRLRRYGEYIKAANIPVKERENCSRTLAKLNDHIKNRRDKAIIYDLCTALVVPI